MLAIAGKLDQVEAEWDRRFALGVVLAAATVIFSTAVPVPEALTAASATV